MRNHGDQPRLHLPPGVRLIVACCFLLAVPTGAGCHSAGESSANGPAAMVEPPIIPADIFDMLKGPEEAHQELCENDGTHPNFPNDADLLTKVFCQDTVGGRVPTPQSLADLQRLLGLEFRNPSGDSGVGGNPGFAILGHSSALTARKISAITPIVFLFTPPPAQGRLPDDFIFMAFDPGEQFIEIASHDPVTDEMNFYLLLFEQACNHAPGGCTPTHLLTPQITKGWSNVRIYESETALNNTIADCRQCHAPDNSKPQILRMQENVAPFTHWFSKETIGGKALLADFHAAHGTTEDYGPVPAAMIDKSNPGQMAALIERAGFGSQPNGFDSATIERQVSASAPDQPHVNMPLGLSAAWQQIYEKAVAGQFIAAPYHDVKVTDPDKLANMSGLYRAWQTGALKELPDIRDVLLDEGLRDMGFAAKAGLNGRELLVQLCQQCHNAKLDLTISRGRFLVDQLDRMSREEKNLAIHRLNLDSHSRLKMPPALFRTVTPGERALMIAELQK